MIALSKPCWPIRAFEGGAMEGVRADFYCRGEPVVACWSGSRLKVTTHPGIYLKGNKLVRVATRAEVWFSNIVASFARYVAERVLPESVPLLIKKDTVIDCFKYTKENMMINATPFFDRYEGLFCQLKRP
jgi:hypothetical protein